MIEFPANPTVGDTVTGEDGTTWVWNGETWDLVGGGGGGGTGPPGPEGPPGPAGADGLVPVFIDAATRLATWPMPPIGSLSVIAGGTEKVSVDIYQSTGWFSLFIAPGDNYYGQVAGRELVTTIGSPVGGTIKAEADGDIQIYAKKVEGVSLRYSLMSTGGGYTLIGGPNQAGAITEIKLDGSVNDSSLLTWSSNFHVAPNLSTSGWVVIGKHTDGSNRALLKVYGKVSSDNLAGLEARMAEVEERLGLPRYVEPDPQSLEQPPPTGPHPTPDDPHPTPDDE